jgi:ABC-type phosphate transport system permease subunit
VTLVSSAARIKTLKVARRSAANRKSVAGLAERLFEAGARVCALLVIAIAPLVIGVLVIASAVAFARGMAAVDLTRFAELALATLFLALVSATLGLIIGAGAGLYTMEVATSALRLWIRAFAGALHAVPAVGFGIVAAGGLLFATYRPSGLIVFAVAAAVLTINIGSIAFVQMRKELARVPAGLREAAAAAGAPPLAIALDIVLPSLRRRIAGLWWNLLATALGEGIALQIIFAAAFARLNAGASPNLSGPYATFATLLLEQGAALRGTPLLSLAPIALTLLIMTVSAVLIGRRAAGQVPWP